MEVTVLVASFTVAIIALVKVWHSPAVSRALAGLSILYFVLWHALPVVSTIALWDSMPTHIATERDFIRTAGVETAAFAAILLLFLKWKAPIAFIQRSALCTFRLSSAAIFAGAAITGLGTAYLHLTDAFGVGYEGRNGFAIKEAGSGALSSLNSLSYFVSLGFCLTCAALIRPAIKSQPKWLTPFLLLVIAYWVYTQAEEGSRIAMFLPVELFILHIAFNKWNRARLMATTAIAGPIFMLLVSLLTITTQSTRSVSSNALEGAGDFSSISLDSPDTRSQFMLDLGNSLTGKFDSFSTGAMLLETYGPGGGGLRTYAGVALASVPRLIYSGKPTPGSSDGTYSGLPSRIMARYLKMDPSIGNVGVDPASVAIWQLGYGNLILLVIVNVINLRVINTLFRSSSSVARGVGLLAVVLPSMMGLIGSPDAILMNLQRFLLILFVFELAVRFLGRRARKSGHGRGGFRSATRGAFGPVTTSAVRANC